MATKILVDVDLIERIIKASPPMVLEADEDEVNDVLRRIREARDADACDRMKCHE